MPPLSFEALLTAAQLQAKDRYARDHARRFAHTLNLSQRFFQPGMKVLSIGTYGHFEQLVQTLFGVTVDQANLMARPGDRFSLNVEVGTWSDQCVGEYDLILFFEVLEHLREHPFHAMKQIRRALKKGGTLLLTTPNSSSYRAILQVLSGYRPYLWSVYEPNRGGMAHVKEYSTLELLNLVRSAGFHTSVHKTFSPYLDDVDEHKPDLREYLIHLGLIWDLAHSTHYLEAQALNDPLLIEYLPAIYDTTDWSV